MADQEVGLDATGDFVRYDDKRTKVFNDPRHRSLEHKSSDDVTLVSVDWTPQDSSYGAACPMCGWIPKKIRKKMEAVVIFSAIFLLIVFLIAGSLRLSSESTGKRSNSARWDENFDDDLYADDYSTSYNDDNVYSNDGYYGNYQYADNYGYQYNGNY
mmetsp:Transcript_7999/g.11885  ORF Transcript_7999/g.11885 Transcript_7999/m.11885 type:complete len:157 (+) Transcript_7999:229-699(+)|eukprot:CAMPEP_0196807090 /NCGR_PEP_ID=MMETSP1362-20130617/7040_1 /TAXON_ID=163516 /ORGANISM="Leptocylindrus danicus, Strain CCMP1856" /LENGTH=156 /DNA_ID=CAMNT_0042180853 /DNA_START=223 /DNA_END=693 /DNA_ORIENTATION=-